MRADAPARRVRHHASSANSAAIREKKSELAQLRAQISSYQNQLDRLNKTEHSSVKAFEAYTRQAHLLKNLIEELNGEEERLTNDIAETQQQITSSQQTLKDLKAQYARAVVSLYKRGTEGDLEVLLSAHNINEAVERSEYLRQFTVYRQRLADNIQATVSDLKEQQTLLTQQRDEKASIATEKEQEQQQLTERASERSKLIDKIRNDKSSLKETLARAQKSSREIESLIGSLVTRESERKQKARADRTPATTH
ncbi:MAG TPA: hypothetical protein VFJ29_00410, partial [Candidatus Kapabacteria bacterium]|nr:hypothetical protein [Candidatus Kapabacteria bacterium]